MAASSGVVGKYLSLSPYDQHVKEEDSPRGGQAHGKWRLTFGEIFYVAAIILERNKKGHDQNYHVLICCEGFNTEEAQRLIRQLYIFFVYLFRENNIKSNILIDEPTCAIIDGLIEPVYTLVGKLASVISKSNFIDGKCNEYQFITKRGLLSSLLKKIKIILDISHKLLRGFRFKDRIADYMNSHYPEKANENAAIIMLRKGNTGGAYDASRTTYEISTEYNLKYFIKSIIRLNKTLGSQDKIKIIYLLGDDPEDPTFFKAGGIDRTPLAVLNEVKGDEIEIRYFPHYKDLGGQIGCNPDFQFLLQAAFIMQLKSRGVKLAMGPNSGGTHALATFGLPTFFPVDTTEDPRYDKAVLYSPSYNRYFPLSPEESGFMRGFLSTARRFIVPAAYFDFDEASGKSVALEYKSEDHATSSSGGEPFLVKPSGSEDKHALLSGDTEKVTVTGRYNLYQSAQITNRVTVGASPRSR